MFKSLKELPRDISTGRQKFSGLNRNAWLEHSKLQHRRAVTRIQADMSKTAKLKREREIGVDILNYWILVISTLSGCMLLKVQPKNVSVVLVVKSWALSVV